MKYCGQSRMCTCLLQHEVFPHNYNLPKLLAYLIHREMDNRFYCVTSLSQGQTLVQRVLHIDRHIMLDGLHRAVFIHHITV